MVNAVLLASLIAPIAALFAATVLYIRRRRPRSAPGRRSAILFALGTLGFAIGGAYLAFQHLPWVFCESPLIFHLSGEWCALSAYAGAPVGFTMGALLYSAVWSLNGTAP
jgi:hypothetical protein